MKRSKLKQSLDCGSRGEVRIFVSGLQFLGRVLVCRVFVVSNLNLGPDRWTFRTRELVTRDDSTWFETTKFLQESRRHELAQVRGFPVESPGPHGQGRRRPSERRRTQGPDRDESLLYRAVVGTRRRLGLPLDPVLFMSFSRSSVPRSLGTFTVSPPSLGTLRPEMDVHLKWYPSDSAPHGLRVQSSPLSRVPDPV